MSKIISIGIVLCAFALSAFAQSANQAAAKWERYGVKDYNFSVLMPKPPIVVTGGNPFDKEMTRSFGAYSDETAYVVTFFFKPDNNSPSKTEKIKEYDENEFAEKAAEKKRIYEQNGDAVTETDFAANDLKVVQLSGERMLHRFYYDPKLKRIYEVLALGANDAKPEVKEFFVSFTIAKNQTSKEIGAGAPNVIGDLPEPIQTAPIAAANAADKNDAPAANTDKPKTAAVTSPLIIVLRPRANYTEEARKASLQGTVVLKVTFSATGAITGITSVKGLGGGLTEQAIAAARKILFLPKTINKTRISVTRAVEFAFNMY